MRLSGAAGLRARLAAWEEELQTNRYGYASAAPMVIQVLRARLAGYGEKTEA